MQRDRHQFVDSVCRIGWIPHGVVGLRWACDYIYTIARNIVYISNALDGFFHFGYQDAVRHFLLMKNKYSLLPLFLNIRLEKYRYRAGDSFHSCINIQTLESISEALADRIVKLKVGGVSKFSESNPRSYEFLRLVERAVVNGEFDDERYLQRLRNHGEYSALLRRQAHLLAEKAN